MTEGAGAEVTEVTINEHGGGGGGGGGVVAFISHKGGAGRQERQEAWFSDR